MQDYNNENVARAVLSKVLADQYDMITYIVDGQYSVFIGDESKIQRGSIFPRKRNGRYEDYLNEQIRPVLTGTTEEREKFYKALTLERLSTLWNCASRTKSIFIASLTAKFSISDLFFIWSTKRQSFIFC